MSQIYNDYYSTFFLEKRNFSKKLYEDEIKRTETILRPYLPVSKESNILEIGCGVGFVLNYLKSVGYENHYGIDISAEAIDICRLHVTPRAKAIPALDYLRQVPETVKYDLIIAFDTIGHFKRDDLIELISLCYSVLNKGGQFICKVNNFLHILGPQLFYRDLTHETPLNEDTLTHLFKSAGFSKVICNEQKPKILRSRIKFYFEKKLHRFIYWLCRHECPKVLSSKIVAVAVKE